MKAYIEFDLEDAFDKENFRKCQKIEDYGLVLYDFYTFMRNYYKYGLPENIKKLSNEELITHIHEKFITISNSYDIDVP